MAVQQSESQEKLVSTTKFISSLLEAGQIHSNMLYHRPKEKKETKDGNVFDEIFMMQII